MTDLVINDKLERVLALYEHQRNTLQASLNEFENACKNIHNTSTIMGTYSGVRLDTGRVHIKDMENSLLKSAWRYLYNELKIDRIAPASDKALFEREMENPPEFTYENVIATFKSYVLNPMDNILRGLAEAFCALDPAYKSHEKVKIGVKGLPKRIIMQNVSDYGYNRDRLQDVLNALAKYQGKPLWEYREVSKLLKEWETFKDTHGIWIKRFSNNNLHLFFDENSLFDINRALAEYYGNALADSFGKDYEPPKANNQAVSKDLQYYPTPKTIVDSVLRDVRFKDDDTVLEPSCGCGRFLDAIRRQNPKTKILGYEIDAQRFSICKDKGYNVLQKNFLETIPPVAEFYKFDYVIMNPPFHGKHYEKHVRHAYKYLKTGGTLISILPSTARYDHNLLNDLNGYWYDLPVGSFKESGTNINISILTIRKR